MASGDVKFAYGTSNQSITITLASLANGSARQSTAINTGTNAEDALVFLKYKTGAASTSSSGFVSIYALGTVDGGTTYTENGGASDAAITLTNPPNAKFIDSFNCVANATTYYGGPFSVASAFGGKMPQRWVLVIENKTGSTADSTAGSFSATYQEIYRNVVP